MINRLAFGFYQLTTAILGRLPLETTFRIGWALGFLGYYLAPSYRRLVEHNLRIAFGPELSPKERRTLARKHFATLAANLLCSVMLPKLPRAEIRARVTMEGADGLAGEVLASGRFTFTIGHMGNWELFAQLIPLMATCPLGTVYQKISNPYLDAELRRDRAERGVALFERKAGFLAAIKMVRGGGGIGVLIDQHAGDGGLWCPLFGRLASTSMLAASIAERTEGWLVPAAIYTDGVARWRCVLQEPFKASSAGPEATSARLNTFLEAQVRRQPADWFWVHNRWKTPRPKFLLASYKRGQFIPTDTKLQPFKILIRSSNWLGDAVMSAPAVRAIKAGRPDAHVTILAPAKLRDFWASLPEVDAVVGIEPGEGVFAVARKIKTGFDAAVVLPNSLRTALEVFLAGIPRRVGYAGHHRKLLLNQVYRPAKKKKKSPATATVGVGSEHQVHHYLALAEFIGADIEGAVFASPRPKKDTSGRPVLGLCPGAEYGPAKRWLPERFAEVMKSLHGSHACEWKLFGVEKDRPVADAISKLAGIPHTDLVGKTTLAELIAQLRSCDVLLTNDTGTMHLAACLGVPVVALFGSTEPTLTGPLGEGHTALRHPVDCSPCFKRECPIDFRCMKAITADSVVRELTELLDRLASGSPGVPPFEPLARAEINGAGTP
jgi:lipopolysaccharide heptosyltransferase II